MEIDGSYNSAIEITKLAYGDENGTRNLDFRVRCKNFEDFINCCKEASGTYGYNEFMWKRVQEVVELQLGEMFNDVTFYIGREGSVVVYIRFGWNIDEEHQKEIMERIKRDTKADELHKIGGLEREWRLWWD